MIFVPSVFLQKRAYLIFSDSVPDHSRLPLHTQKEAGLKITIKMSGSVLIINVMQAV